MMTSNGSGDDDDKGWWSWCRHNMHLLVRCVMHAGPGVERNSKLQTFSSFIQLISIDRSFNCLKLLETFNWFLKCSLRIILDTISKFQWQIQMEWITDFGKVPIWPKGAFPFIFLPRCRAMHVRLSEACWLPESKWGSTERQIQNFADRKSKAATKDKSGDGNLAQSLDFAAEEVVRANYSFHHTTFSRKLYYKTRNESFSFLSVAFYAIWDNLWGSGYEAPFEAENSFRAEFFWEFFADSFLQGRRRREGWGAKQKREKFRHKNRSTSPLLPRPTNKLFYMTRLQISRLVLHSNRWRFPKLLSAHPHEWQNR